MSNEPDQRTNRDRRAADRRQSLDADYAGPERRKASRRTSERRAGE